MKYIQSKIKFITLCCFILVFSGCSQSAFKYFDKKDEFVQNAQYTKVMKIVQDDTVKAMAYITYLNDADNDKWNNEKENFIIGLYIIDKNEKYTLELKILEKKKIQLDEQNIEYDTVLLEPVSEKIITKADSLYSDIPFRNNWAEYKLISYELVKEKKNLTFTFQDQQKNSVQTSFIKE